MESDSDSDSDYVDPTYKPPPKAKSVPISQYDVESSIEDGDIDDIKKYIEDGYTTASSFGGCPCCYEPNDLARAFHNRHLEVFKVLLQVTTDDDLPEVCSDVSQSGGIPYMKILRERMTIGPEYLVEFIQGNGFNGTSYNQFAKFVAEKEEVCFDKLDLSSKNRKLYRKLLDTGKLNVDGAMGSMLSQIMYRSFRDEVEDKYLTDSVKYCMDMGADTSKHTSVLANGWLQDHVRHLPRMKQRTSENGSLSSLVRVMVSLDELAFLVKNFPICVLTDLEKFKLGLHSTRVNSLVEICSYNNKESAMVIQRSYRVYRSKKISNTLRAEPLNLFCPVFSKRRKLLLKIDDSCFG